MKQINKDIKNKYVRDRQIKIRQIRKALLASMAILLCLFSVPQSVSAAEARVSIALSQSSLRIGDTVAVTVRISTDGLIGSYSMAVTYNNAVLEYTGGAGNGGGGTVLISGFAGGTETSLSATLNFKAVANGSCTITTSNGNVYNWQEEEQTISYAGATVTVSAPQAPASTEGGSGGEAGTTEALKGSGDNSLKSLEISPGTLTPEFQPGTTTYSVQLPEDTTSIVVSAVPNDSKATVAVSHNNDLEPGQNKTYIVVTAENGTQKTYVLNILCGEAEDTDDAEAQTVTVNGREYTIASSKQLEEVSAPEGFTTGEADYAGIKIPVYFSPNHKLQLVYLLNAEEQGSWYIYTPEPESFVPYIEETNAANRYVILTPAENVTIPAGYQKTELDLNGNQVTAYVQNGDDRIVLLYAMNLNGEAGFYFYDMTEGTYQRYQELQQVLPEPEEPTVAEPVITEEPDVSSGNGYLKAALYILSGISAVMLGMLIYLGVRMKRDEIQS